MNMHNPASGNAPGLSAGALERLALFAEWTKTEPPTKILDGEGENRTFAAELLIYADANGMSLDWFWLGNERGLVMQAFHQARGIEALPKSGTKNNDAIREERDRLDCIVTEAEGLIHALQIVLWEFSSTPLNKEARCQRQAIIAIGDALERIIRRIDGACD